MRYLLFAAVVAIQTGVVVSDPRPTAVAILVFVALLFLDTLVDRVGSQQ